MANKLSIFAALALLAGTTCFAQRPGESGKYEAYDNMALLYGGNLQRNPACWTKDRMEPHVTYVDRQGKEHWLFDAFLILEIYDKPADGETTAFGLGSGGNSGNRQSWTNFLDYWFNREDGLKALDEAVGEAIARLGEPATKRKVVISIPDAIPYQNFKDTTSSTRFWGKLNGRQMDFSKGKDRVSAVRWYVDEALRRFKAAKFKNLELEGFYCFSEELATPGNGWNYELKRWDEVYPAVSDYVHKKGYSMSWIPYNWAAGTDRWEQFHFDFVMMQPNYIWRPDYDMEDWKSRVRNNNLSMELEIDDNVLYGSRDWETYRERFYYYFQMCKDLGLYGNCVLSYYMGSNTLYKLAHAENPADQKMYHDFCGFILGNIQH